MSVGGNLGRTSAEKNQEVIGRTSVRSILTRASVVGSLGRSAGKRKPEGRRREVVGKTSVGGDNVYFINFNLNLSKYLEGW